MTKIRETQNYDEAYERIITDLDAGLYHHKGSPSHVVGINDEGRARLYPNCSQPEVKEGHPYRGHVASLVQAFPGAPGMAALHTHDWIVEDIGGTFTARVTLEALLDSLAAELREMFEGGESPDAAPPVGDADRLYLPGSVQGIHPGHRVYHLLTGPHLWIVREDQRDGPPQRRVPRTPETDDLLRRCHAALAEKLLFIPDAEPGSVVATMRENYIHNMRGTFAGLEKHLGVRAPEQIARLLDEVEPMERGNA